ncbi:hypothetical protein [Streptomyces sp. NPDC050848]|uniref:hypothetical protein n=1 Tax=Streptomyces sp. NPDC050848 TaxID=3155791 RepID=UPI0033FED88D
MFRVRMVQAAAFLAVTAAALLAPAAVAQADAPVPPPAAAVITEPVQDGTEDMGWQ